MNAMSLSTTAPRTSAVVWTPLLVWDWIRETLDTARSLPGHRPMSHRIYWPDIARRRDTDYGDPMKYTDEGETRTCASSAAIGRLDEVQRWLTWLSYEDRKIIYYTLRKCSDRRIGRRLGIPHRLIAQKREEALRGIALRLTLEGNSLVSDA